MPILIHEPRVSFQSRWSSSASQRRSAASPLGGGVCGALPRFDAVVNEAVSFTPSVVLGDVLQQS